MFTIYADDKLLYSPMNIKSEAIFQPKLNIELGKAGFLNFSVSHTHSLYNDIKKMLTNVRVEHDGKEIWGGRVISEDKNFNLTKSIYCEGYLSYLSDSVQKNIAFKGKNHDFFKHIIDEHNNMVEDYKKFKIGIISIPNSDVIIEGQDDNFKENEDYKLEEDDDYGQMTSNAVAEDWINTYEYINSNLINNVGGYLKVRSEQDGLYIDYLLEYTNNVSTQNIQLGLNLLDLTINSSAEGLFTVLIPIGDENLTIKSVNNGSVELVNEEAVAQYSRIVKTNVFNNVNNPNTLLENGLRYLKNESGIKYEISIKAIDLHLIDDANEEFKVGDSIRLISEKHSLNDSFVCTKIEYDLENPQNTSYGFGSGTQGITQRYKEDAKKRDRRSRERAVATGRRGGKKAKQEIDKFNHSYVNWDPKIPIVSLGAVYTEFKNAKKVLQNQIGIDIDAPKGTLNIFNMKEQFDENEILTQRNRTQIDMNSERIELSATQIKGLAKRYAQIIVDMNGIKSEVVSEKDGIKALTSRVEQTEYAIKHTVENKIAGTKTLIEQTETGIYLHYDNKVDKINKTLFEVNKNVTNINTEITNVKTLIAQKIEAVKSQVTYDVSNAVSTNTLSANYGYFKNTIFIGSGYNLKPVATKEDVHAIINNRGCLTSLPSHKHTINLGSQRITGIKVPTATGTVSTSEPILS